MLTREQVEKLSSLIDEHVRASVDFTRAVMSYEDSERIVEASGESRKRVDELRKYVDSLEEKVPSADAVL